MSIQKLITLNILFSQGKPNNTHSSRWSKLEISNSLIFIHHLNQYFQNLLALSHFRKKCWMSSSSVLVFPDLFLILKAICCMEGCYVLFYIEKCVFLFLYMC